MVSDIDVAVATDWDGNQFYGYIVIIGITGHAYEYAVYVMHDNSFTRDSRNIAMEQDILKTGKSICSVLCNRRTDVIYRLNDLSAAHPRHAGGCGFI